MEVTYRRDGEHNYMIWKAPEAIQGSEYEVRMLLVNEIPGLLRCRMRNIDGISCFYYEITSKQPIARIFEHRAAGGEDIRALVLAIGRTLEGIERYLLPEDGLLLEPELIYMDVETKEVSFGYLPCCQENIKESFRSLAEYLLKNLDHEDEQAVFWGYQLYSGTVEENYSVRAVLRNLYGKLEKRAAEKAAPERKAEAAADEKMREEKRCKRKENEDLPVRRMVTGQERLNMRDRRKKAAGAALVVLLCLGGVTALAVFHILTLTQAGGILFLAAGVFYYLCAGKKEKQEKPGEKKESKKHQRKEKTRRKDRKKDRKKDRGEPGGREQDGEGQRGREQVRGGQGGEEKQMEEGMRREVWSGEMSERDWKNFGEPETGRQEDMPEEEICDFREDSGEEIYGQTTLLGGGITGGHPVLISSNPDVRENVVIDKEKFIVGKLKGQVDLALNLPVISRMHAGIERREEGYFLVDLNSTNGTYLNGERLEANEYRQIQSGDEIIFAGAGYYFKE